MNSTINFFVILVIFAINGEGMPSAGHARAPAGVANELADQGHYEEDYQFKNPEDTPSARSFKAPGTMTENRNHATLDLHVASKKPVIPSESLLDLQSELKGTGFIVEHFDTDNGLITLRDTTLKRTNATTPAKNKEPTKHMSGCPTFQTLKNGSITLWMGLKRVHGVKEGLDVIVNATQITLASIVDCATKIFSNVGTWLGKHPGPKSKTRNASTTVSTPPTTKPTAPKDFKTKTVESSGRVGPRGALNINPLDGLEHDSGMISLLKPNGNVQIFHNPTEHKT